MQYLIPLAFVAILASLFAAMFFMLKGGTNQTQKPSKKMAKALAFRVGFSILIFLCVLLAWKLGYINPTGIRVGQ